MKAFIEANFKMLDINGDGVVSAEEYRYNCITRIAVDDIQIVDEAFNKMLNVSLKKSIFLFYRRRKKKKKTKPIISHTSIFIHAMQSVTHKILFLIAA